MAAIGRHECATNFRWRKIKDITLFGSWKNSIQYSMAMNSINSVYQGGMNFTTLINGHSITIDLNKAAGGVMKTGPKILMLVHWQMYRGRCR